MTNLKITSFLSEDQRQQLNQFPETIEQNDLIQYFLLSDCDLEIIPVRSHAYSRLGFALSLCALRFLGFIPDELVGTPEIITAFILKQLGLHEIPADFNLYGTRAQTRSDHVLSIEKYLGFRRLDGTERELLNDWLLSQAMEHDRPILLLRAAIDKLKRDRITRPPLAFLERLVGSVRDQARKKTYQLLSGVISNERKVLLDDMLKIDKTKGKTILTWLRQRAVSHSPESICQTLEKIDFLEVAGVSLWDMSMVNFNRLKFLSRLAQSSTNQALQRSIPERRYPILVAFMFQALEELIDEVIELFDQSISQTYTRAKNSLKKHQEQVQEDINEKVRMLKTIGSIILDENIADPQLRQELYGRVSYNKLRLAIDDCNKLMRPEHDKGLDYFANRFSYLRQYTPLFLRQLQFKSLQDDDPVLKAIEVIKEMNLAAIRKVPKDAPTAFINSSWRQYVFNDNKIELSYYELCTLWELRNCLRSSDIWVSGGRRYNNPEHYLIPKPIWPEMKKEICNLLQIPQIFEHSV